LEVERKRVYLKKIRKSKTEDVIAEFAENAENTEKKSDTALKA